MSEAATLNGRSGPARRSIDLLRVYHSGVVTEYRQRERELQNLGVRVSLVTARRWNEGGGEVALDPAGDQFVVGVGTLGRHPYLFLYDPWPLIRLLRGQHFDVIDAHEEPAALATAEIVLLCRLLKPHAKVTLYSAQNLAKRYPPPFRWLERLALHSVAAVHCCNEAAAANLRAKGFAGRLTVLGLGVDVQRFEPPPITHAAAAAGPGDPAADTVFRLGFVGRVEARKGIWVLLDAVARLLCEADVSVTFVGDGPDRPELQRQIDERGLGAVAKVEGFRPHEDLPATYRSFDVVCVPSLPTPGWMEQFGRVAVEAMASGVPVVASASGSLPEVVGDAGMLVDAGDAESLADALLRLARDGTLRAELGRRGRERAQRYAWPRIAEAQQRLYFEVLA